MGSLGPYFLYIYIYIYLKKYFPWVPWDTLGGPKGWKKHENTRCEGAGALEPLLKNQFISGHLNLS